MHERSIEPHIPVFDKSARTDGSFARSDFIYDHKHDRYTCPGGKELKRSHRNFTTPRSGVDQDGFIRYRASKQDCDGCSLKPRCCPGQPARKVPRSVHEGARDMARDLALTDAYATSRRERKKIEMLFAHLKRILKLDRLRLRGPNGAKDEFLLASSANFAACSQPRQDVRPKHQWGEQLHKRFNSDGPSKNDQSRAQNLYENLKLIALNDLPTVYAIPNRAWFQLCSPSTPRVPILSPISS